MKARVFFAPLVLAVVVLIAVVAWAPAGEPSETTTGPEPAPVPPPTTTVKVERRIEGRTARQWHSIAKRYLDSRRSLQRTLLYRPNVGEALNLACVTYAVSCSTLWRKARCESGLYAYARNPSGASGLLQFLPTTWRSTPYGGFSIYSVYAQAMAGAWMHRAGRGGEWVCR